MTIETTGWADEEHFVAHDESAVRRRLAQELWENGLIYLVNRTLHLFGYAIGVDLNDAGAVIGLVLYASNDPQGVWFDEETELKGRRKFYRALKGLAGHLGW